jgi:hypothetical protein
MSIGSIGGTSSVVPMASLERAQKQPATTPVQNTIEETKESPKERAQEANKGESVDTYA